MTGLIEQLLRYGLSGVINTLVGYGVIFGLMLLSIPPETCNAVGYAVGLLVAFTLSRRWVFGSDAPPVPQMLRFLAAFLLAFGLNFTILRLLMSYGGNAYMAQIGGGIAYSTLFFLLSRSYVFSHSANEHAA